MKYKILLSVSLLLNVVLAYMCWHKSGTQDNSQSSVMPGQPPLAFQMEVSDGDIVFLGESRLGACNWSLLLADDRCQTLAYNGNDLKSDIERMKHLFKGVSPERFILMYGEAELLSGMEVGEIAEQYEQLVGVLKERFPATEVVLLSVLPMRNPNDNNFNLTMSDKVKNLNIFLKTIASRHDYPYVNLYADFVTAEGTLNPEYSLTDGFFLNKVAYIIAKDRLKEFLNN
ncbi:MAG: hypothetical protein IKN77_00450 [Paludibacteraceae bacterium]|nr:hypothetical protein [Paludibacteraceae bacterium]